MADVFGIDKLKSKIGGFAKGNRYNVTFADLPAGLSTTTNENLQYLCEAISLPTKSLASTPQDIYGPPREIPYRETFTEAALSFILDDAFTIKRFFDKWQANIINPETGNIANYWTDITGTIKITRLDNAATNTIGGYDVELREWEKGGTIEVKRG